MHAKYSGELHVEPGPDEIEFRNDGGYRFDSTVIRVTNKCTQRFRYAAIVSHLPTFPSRYISIESARARARG